MAKDIDNLIRRKMADRERLMKQVRQIDVELEALEAARGGIAGLQSLKDAAAGRR